VCMRGVCACVHVFVPVRACLCASVDVDVYSLRVHECVSHTDVSACICMPIWNL